jgi:hypothetical protein
VVLVDQSVDDRSASEPLGRKIGWRWLGWAAVQAPVGPVLVVVREVVGKHAAQVTFVVDQQPVRAFPAQGADPTLADRVRPGCLDRSFNDLDALGSEDGVEAGGVLGVPVPDQKPKRYLQIHQQITGLLGHPRPGRVLGETEQVYAAGGGLDARPARRSACPGGCRRAGSRPRGCLEPGR